MAIKFHNPNVRLGGGQVQPGRRGAARRQAVLRLGPGSASIRAASCRPASTSSASRCWKNIAQVLKSAGMGYRDIVKVNVFLTDSRFIGPYRTVTRSLFSASRPIRRRPCSWWQAWPIPACWSKVEGGWRPSDLRRRERHANDCLLGRRARCRRRCRPCGRRVGAAAARARPCCSRPLPTASRSMSARRRTRASRGPSRRRRPICSTRQGPAGRQPFLAGRPGRSADGAVIGDVATRGPMRRPGGAISLAAAARQES